MDQELQKMYNEFCLLKDKLNSESVTKKTAGIIGRFSKALKSAEEIVSNPPKVDRSFEANFKIKNFIAKPQKEIKELEDKLKNPKKKPGPKPGQKAKK